MAEATHGPGARNPEPDMTESYYPDGAPENEFPTKYDQEPTNPLDLLFNRSRFMLETSKYTSAQLNTLLDLMYTAVRNRQIRRWNVFSSAVENAISIYLKNNPLLVNGERVEFMYCVHYEPQHEVNRRLIKDHTLKIYFLYGDEYYGKIFKDAHASEDLHKPRYDLSISQTQISLKPPIHHVVDCPTTQRTESGLRFESEITDPVTIKWEQANGKPMTLIGPDKKTRKDVYGDLEKPLIDYFINKKHAYRLLDLAHRVYIKYHTYPIGKAKAATMTFLIIGRCRGIYAAPNMPICYDVIKIIAQMIWESRDDHVLWSTITPDPPGHRLQCEDTYDEYNEQYGNIPEGMVRPPKHQKHY